MVRRIVKVKDTEETKETKLFGKHFVKIRKETRVEILRKFFKKKKLTSENIKKGILGNF